MPQDCFTLLVARSTLQNDFLLMSQCDHQSMCWELPKTRGHICLAPCCTPGAGNKGLSAALSPPTRRESNNLEHAVLGRVLAPPRAPAPMLTPQTPGVTHFLACVRGPQGPGGGLSLPGCPLPPGAGDRLSLRPQAPEPRVESALLPRPASPPHRAGFSVRPSGGRGQRMLCHPTYFSRALRNRCLLGKHFEQLGERCPWLR